MTENCCWLREYFVAEKIIIVLEMTNINYG